MVNLDESAYTIVARVIHERGLGGRGFSKAVRLIIREWDELQRDNDFPKSGRLTRG
jgi:hypothetical protein